MGMTKRVETSRKFLLRYGTTGNGLISGLKTLKSVERESKKSNDK